MCYKIETGSIWEFGQRKDAEGNPHQEDNLFPAHGKLEPSNRVFILCDGMGGHASGEVASQAVCDAMAEYLVPRQASFAETDINDAVTAAYNALDKLDSGSWGRAKMGTTMTCLVLHKHGATVAHMGDSRVYHIRPGKEREDTSILFQTRDHSLVSDLVFIGELTPEEARNHQLSNIINRALQPHMEKRQSPDIKTLTEVQAGDWFFLCSDGMLEQMDDNVLKFIFSQAAGSIENKLNMLTQATRENRDNHTAILVHILEADIEPENEQPQALQPIMGTLEDAEPEPEQSPITAAQQQDEPHSSVAPATYSSKPKKGALLVLVLLLSVACLFVFHKICSSVIKREKNKTEVNQAIQTPKGNVEKSRTKPETSTNKTNNKLADAPREPQAPTQQAVEGTSIGKLPAGHNRGNKKIEEQK